MTYLGKYFFISFFISGNNFIIFNLIHYYKMSKKIVSKVCNVYIKYIFGISFITGVCLFLFGIYKLNELMPKKNRKRDPKKKK